MSLGPPAPDVLQEGSSLNQVIAAVNHNASRVTSYQTNNASISVPGMPGIPLLQGNIAAQQPGRVRLQASAPLLGAQVDLGSNDELFWFWVKQNEPPALYFCRHDQFVGSAAQQVMPIEPQWLIDALGMLQFSPNDQHDGPFPYNNNEALEIRSIIQTRGGQMTKSTVIDARRAWVLEQHIYDATGTLVASTRVKSHRYHESMGVSLPQEIELRIPAAQLSLSINVGDVQLNNLANNPALWSLPVLSSYPQIDLGTASPGTVPRVGSAGSRDWNTLASPSIVGLTPQTLRQSPPNSANLGHPQALPTSPSVLPSANVLPPHSNSPPSVYTPLVPRQ